MQLARQSSAFLVLQMNELRGELFKLGGARGAIDFHDRLRLPEFRFRASVRRDLLVAFQAGRLPHLVNSASPVMIRTSSESNFTSSSWDTTQIVPSIAPPRSTGITSASTIG
jgi:hypothetical protein